MAARSLIQLFREKNPGLLHKKDRVSQDEAGIQRHLNFFYNHFKFNFFIN